MMFLCSMIDSEEKRSKFERIYSEYRITMYSVAFDVTKNYHDAEDIVEEALVKVIGILNKIDPENIGTQKCKNLMITIAKNQAVDYWRKKKREAIPMGDLERYEPSKDGETLCVELESYRELLVYIDNLDQKYRDVFRLKILHDLTSREIAYLLDISVANVNMRFMRAKKMLMEKLKGEERNG